MNQKNFNMMLSKYMEKFDLVNNEKHNETFKWDVFSEFADKFDLEAEDFMDNFAKAIKGADVLLNQYANGKWKYLQTVKDAITYLLTRYKDINRDIHMLENQIQIVKAK